MDNFSNVAEVVVQKSVLVKPLLSCKPLNAMCSREYGVNGSIDFLASLDHLQEEAFLRGTTILGKTIDKIPAS